MILPSGDKIVIDGNNLNDLEKKCLEERYSAKENLVKVLRGGLDEEVLESIKSSPDMIKYIQDEGQITFEKEGVDYEYVFVQVNRRGSPCHKKEF